MALDRQELFRTQTPHTYTLEKLLWAHEMAQKRNIMNTTATCTLMSALGEKYISPEEQKKFKDNYKRRCRNI